MLSLCLLQKNEEKPTHLFTNVFFKGSAVSRSILKEPAVAPNMWYQKVKQYPWSPAGGSSVDFSWATFPFTLGRELLM